MSQDNQAQMGDELDYVALAANAEAKARSAESLHLAVLWCEMAETYRELAAYHRPRNEGTPSDQGMSAGQVSSEERVMQSPLRCLILISALSVIASAGCDAGAPGRDLGNNRSVMREDAYKGQVALDVTAIVAGMTRAHGAQAVALLPKWWQDFLSQP